MKKKKVKNLSIRVKATGVVVISVPARMSFEKAKEFVLLKQDWILKHLEKMQTKQWISLGTIHWKKEFEQELQHLVMEYWKYLEPYHLQIPVIRYRKMKGSWGICRKERGMITLNKALILVSKECQAYVVAHELSHLVEANHSKAFYRVLAHVMPEYKEYEERLKEYAIQD